MRAVKAGAEICHERCRIQTKSFRAGAESRITPRLAFSFFTLDNLFPSGYSHQRGPGLNAGRLIFLRRSQCCRDWGPCSWEEGLRGFASRHALLSPLTSNCLLTRL